MPTGFQPGAFQSPGFQQGSDEFKIGFAGLTLDGVVEYEESLPSRVSIERFPRRQGAIVPDVPFLAERQLRFVYDVYKPSAADLRVYLASIKQALNAGKGRLYLRNDNLYLIVVKTNYSYGLRAGEAPAVHARGAIDFIASDPYYYSGAGEQSVSDLNVPSSPHIFSATNDGGAATPVRVEIKALSVNKTGTFKLDLTTIGLFVSWTGTILANSSMMIDCAAERFSVTANGANGLKDFGGSRQFMLTPGLNNFSYSGPTGVDVKVYWTERWD